MPVEDQALASAAVPVHGGHGGHDNAGEHDLPHESLSPITLAAGIGLLAFGLLTSPVFSIVGLGVMGWALARWIEEMRHG
jgi:hypothetical protein